MSPRTHRIYPATMLLLFSTALSIARAGQRFSPEEKKLVRDYLSQVAQKLTNNAVKKDQGIGWVNVSSDDKSEESVNFYDGDSGTCYFFLKAYAGTKNDQYLSTAKQCMAYILSQANRDDAGLYFNPRVNGFFEGNSGPGYLFLYAYHVTGNKEYLKTSEDIAERIVAKPDISESSSPDIISGAAGTGLFLLKIHEITKKPEYLQAAAKLGDFVVSKALPVGNGVKWRAGQGNVTYYFVGFSHGPAGMGYFLLRLYTATKDPKYKECADKAMQHIANIAISEKGYVKWYHEELKQNTRYSSQWCHGNPGMTPFFLELYEVTKDKSYLEWARKNTLYILDQGVNVRKNGSVCHGISGNTAALWVMYQETKDSSYFDDVRDGVKQLEASVKKESDGYYWDSPGHKIDYGYNTGLAGIGDFLVMLYTDGKLNMMGGLGFGDDL
jgi:lantibiotic modifying enzyme